MSTPIWNPIRFRPVGRPCVNPKTPVSTRAIIVIPKPRRAKNADLLQPVGLPAISRGLSEATPPDNAEKNPRPRRGRSNRPMNRCALPKTLQMQGSDWWYPKAAPRRLRPLRGRCFIRFAVRGCRFAQPPANSLNPFGVLLLPQRLVYNDESSGLGARQTDTLPSLDARLPASVPVRRLKPTAPPRPRRRGWAGRFPRRPPRPGTGIPESRGCPD